MDTEKVLRLSTQIIWGQEKHTFEEQQKSACVVKQDEKHMKKEQKKFLVFLNTTKKTEPTLTD